MVQHCTANAGIIHCHNSLLFLFSSLLESFIKLEPDGLPQLIIFPKLGFETIYPCKDRCASK